MFNDKIIIITPFHTIYPQNLARNLATIFYFVESSIPRSVWFRVKEEELVDLIEKLFEEHKITFDYITKSKDSWLIYDKQFLARHADLLRKIHQIRVKEFTSED